MRATQQKAITAQRSTLWQRSFIGQVWQALVAIFQDKGVFTMVVIAPILYGFFYPWPYHNEVAQHVPVAIVDNDHTFLSAKIIDYAKANPRINSTVVTDETAAQQMLWHHEIAGYLVIPSGLYQKVVSGQTARVSILGNGGYFLLNKQVQTGFMEAVGTVSAGVEIQQAVARGAYSQTAKASTSPVTITINPLYNTTEGYGSYIVPPVSILILQQMFLMGSAMLVGTWAERRVHIASLKTWLARIVALSLLGVILGCFYYGWVFPMNDYPRNQNLMGSLVFLLLFFPAVVTMGCVVGIWFRERERAMQILIFSSMPIMFLSGVSWPVQLLPEPLQYLRWLFPSTPGMNASVLLNQMGASLADVKVYLSALLLMFLVSLSLLVWFATDSDAVAQGNDQPNDV